MATVERAIGERLYIKYDDDTFILRSETANVSLKVYINKLTWNALKQFVSEIETCEKSISLTKDQKTA